MTVPVSRPCSRKSLGSGIVHPLDYLASDPKADDGPKKALRKIFLSGWFCKTEIVAGIRVV